VVAELDGLGPALARIVAEGGASVPGRICEACLAVLPVTRAAVTVMTSADRQEPIWASDEVASHLDELQFSLGEGPCVEAFTAGRPVLVPDLAELSGHRWPMFADAARRTSVQALFVLPLQAGAIVVGVLDLYRDATGMLAPDELAAALRTADALLWALLGLRNGPDADGSPGDISLDPPLIFSREWVDLVGAGLVGWAWVNGRLSGVSTDDLRSGPGGGGQAAVGRGSCRARRNSSSRPGSQG
jgi:GAF domain